MTHRITWMAVTAFAALVWGAGVPAQAAGETWIERLLFNARERTARGIEALRGTPSAPAAPDGAPAATDGLPDVAPTPPGGAPETPSTGVDAIAPLDSALRLRGDDPVSQFNAGTARLHDNRGDAVPLLEAATQAGDPRLAARAAYNLGNAHLSQRNYQPAIDAFKTALRHDPTTTAAKHNLEVAQKLLEQQQQQNQDQQQDGDQQQDQEQQDDQDQEQQQDGDQQQDQEQEEQQDGEQQQDQDQQGDQDQEQQQDQDQDQEQQDQDQQDEQDQEQQQNGDQQQQQERPLPQFEDLPDMTAEEAAAILEAVENLEREARRQEALAAAAQAQATGKKDW